MIIFAKFSENYRGSQCVKNLLNFNSMRHSITFLFLFLMQVNILKLFKFLEYGLKYTSLPKGKRY